jgi:hypothetical protein
MIAFKLIPTDMEKILEAILSDGVIVLYFSLIITTLIFVFFFYQNHRNRIRKQKVGKIISIELSKYPAHPQQ